MSITGAACAYARELGVEIPAGFHERVTALLQGLGLGTYPGTTPPHALASAWRLFLDQDSGAGDRETLERISALGALYDATQEYSPQLRDAFSAAHLNLTRSRMEMALRLASRLYMMGRKFKLDRRAANDGARLLRAAVWYFDQAAEFDDWLRPPARLKLFGMRGVALLLLARGGLELERLSQALQDLTTSNTLGDRSVQNLAYRREGALRLYDQHRDPAVLATMEALLEEGGPRDSQYFSDLAGFHQFSAGGIVDAREGDATPHFDACIAACEAGLAHCETTGDDDHHIFYNVRGFIRFQSATAGPRREREDAIALFDLAIADLQKAAAAGLGGASLALALLRRANVHKAADLRAARDDLMQAAKCLDLANAELATRIGRQIEASILDCSLREVLDAGDMTPAADLCLQLLDFGEEAERHLLVLLSALRAAWATLAGPPSDELIEASGRAVTLAQALTEREAEDDERLGFMLGYAAGLSYRLDPPEPSARTLALFRDAISRQEAPSAILLGQAADTALRAGKHRARSNDGVDAEGLFEDSVEWYEAAMAAAEREGADLPETFRPVVCHSKAGEAYLRLRSGSMGSHHVLQQSIRHFEAARALGNETVELSGLLGDAYYRLGYHMNNPADLRTALELKLRARADGHSNRENFSVVARIYHRLFELEGDAQLLACAVESAVLARDKSDQWPWPLFQLAEMALAPATARQNMLAHLPRDVHDDVHVRWTADGNRGKLLEDAVLCAVNSDEFNRAVLGGRSRVFILDDPHRLLSTTLVVKPCKLDPRAARKEMQLIKALGTHLAGRGLTHRFGLPTPIALVRSAGGHSPGNYFYATERARADGLDRRILGENRRGYQGHREVREALDFLAVFHAWGRAESREAKPDPRLRRKFANYVRDLGGNDRLAYAMADDFAALLPNVPMVRKCDAHPENWLVQPRGRTIMIDLEADSWELCLLDVVQLLDDYPVFSADLAGWRIRMELCADYWSKALGARPDPDMIEAAYAALAIFRCAFGLQYCEREAGRRNASSSLRALETRRLHYQALLSFIAANGASPEARDLAATLAGLAGRQPTTVVGDPNGVSSRDAAYLEQVS
jgi:hypothetical protein